MVVKLELALIERKQSRRFWHKSIICKKATKRVRKCAKVKGRVELKKQINPRVKTFSYDSPNYTTPTVSVLTSTYTQI